MYSLSRFRCGEVKFLIVMQHQSSVRTQKRDFEMRTEKPAIHKAEILPQKRKKVLGVVDLLKKRKDGILNAFYDLYTENGTVSGAVPMYVQSVSISQDNKISRNIKREDIISGVIQSRVLDINAVCNSVGDR